jgi:hypothetical protein
MKPPKILWKLQKFLKIPKSFNSLNSVKSSLGLLHHLNDRAPLTLLCVLRAWLWEIMNGRFSKTLAAVVISLSLHPFNLWMSRLIYLFPYFTCRDTFHGRCTWMRCWTRWPHGRGKEIRDLYRNDSRLAEVAQTRTQGRHRTVPLLQAVWWDTKCDLLSNAKLVVFGHFRSNGNPHTYNEYKITDRNLNYSCKTKKIESWRRYGANMTYETRLTDIWKMAKRLQGSRSSTVTDRNPGSWLPGFESRITPDFVSN